MAARVSALLSGKRRSNVPSDAVTGSPTNDGRTPSSSRDVSLSPEKSRVPQDSTRRDRALSFAESPLSATAGGQRLRHKPSLDMHHNHQLPLIEDGTPVAYDSTTEANHSRSGNFIIDDGTSYNNGARARRGTNVSLRPITPPSGSIVPSPLHGTYANGSPELGSTSRMSRSQSVVQHRHVVGEGSLSLDTLIRSASIPELEQPPPQIVLEDAKNRTDTVRFSVTDTTLQQESRVQHLSTSPVQRIYHPVFEHSDMERSSSSSSTDSGAIRQVQGPTIQLDQAQESAASQTIYTFPDRTTSPARAATAGATLQPSAAGGLLDSASKKFVRGRSSSTVSSTDIPPPTASKSSFFSRSTPSPAPPTIPANGENKMDVFKTRKASVKRKGRPEKGIAGALALSGVALASPAPPLSQPLHLAGMHDQDGTRPRQRSSTETTSQSATSQTNSRSSTTLQLVPSQTSDDGSHPNLDYDSPSPHYTPNDSPTGYDEDGFEAYNGMVSIDALGDFDDVVSQLGAGYALASTKRNTDFHAIFKNVPEDDYLIEDYGCALQREILIQGRLYISEHHLCFNANIFGWVTTVILAFSEIVTIEKRNTALVIPNAIHIATLHSRHTFASFISRDMTYDLIVSLWRNQHPVVPSAAALPDTVGSDDEDVLSNGDDGLGEATEVGQSAKKRHKSKKGRFRRNKHTATTGDVEERADAEDPSRLAAAQGRPSLANSQLGKSQLGKGPSVAHPTTTCTCLSPGGSGHYPNLIMDTTFPGSPEKLYNLIFTSGFMKQFLVNDMKLLELHIGDWAPQTSGSHLLTRSYNYIKPLSGPVGPKQTKCILVDENLHVDFDDFAVTLTTTRTPDVPSGGIFSVKTKTCIMWAKNNSSRVLVTTSVEWTGRSLIRGIIDKSSIEGQKQLYQALEKSVRGYINQHKNEFYEGNEEDGHLDGTDSIHTDNGHGRDGSSANQGGLDASTNDQNGVVSSLKAKDHLPFITNAIPQLKPAVDFLSTIYDTIKDLVGQMSVTALICSAIIFVLVVSNIFTLSSLRQKSSRYVPPRRPPPDYSKLSSTVAFGEGDATSNEVASAVRDVLQEYFQAHKQNSGHTTLSQKVVTNTKEEVVQLQQLLDGVQSRIEALRTSLEGLD